MSTPNFFRRFSQPWIMARRHSGFTMVELIAVLIIVGILAVYAMPRLTGGTMYAALAFHDDTVSALRFAQKSAVSHRRLVCANLTQTSVSLTIAGTNDPATTPSCAVALNDPSGNPTYANSSDATNVKFLAFPATIYFQPSGAVTSDLPGATAIASALTFFNSSASDIAVWGATGYVK